MVAAEVKQKADLQQEWRVRRLQWNNLNESHCRRRRVVKIDINGNQAT